MGRSQETFNKKEVRNKKLKKKVEKEKRRLAKREKDKKSSLDDMIAYVDENGMITSTPPDPDDKEEIKAEDIEIGVPQNDTSDDADPFRKGILSFYNESKGYGFIKEPNSKISIFVHVNDMIDDLREGNVVIYEVEKGKKGPVAKQVKLFK